MITKKEVQHIAKLARLGLLENELEKFQKELSSILDFVKKLQEADTSKVEPISHITGAKNVTRKDRARKNETEKVRKILDEAPELKEGYIKVKAVF